MKKRFIINIRNILSIFLIMLLLSGCTKKEVKNLIFKIENIGTMTVETGVLLTEIRDAYNVLNDDDKEKVSNYAQFESAVAEYKSYMLDLLTDELEAAPQLIADYFAQNYDTAELIAAQTQAEIIGTDTDISQFAMVYENLKLQNDALRAFIESENERVMNECMNSVKLGLQTRWDFQEKEHATFEEYENNIKTGIEAELKGLEEYRDIPFADKGFSDIISNYVHALESEQEGMNYVFTDPETYVTLSCENGMDVRKELLAQLKDWYGLTVEAGYEKYYADFLNGKYDSRIAPGEKVVVNATYGEVGVTFLGFDVLVNPSDEKELVLYCAIENISYFDEYNEDMIDVDDIMSIYGGEGYSINPKNSWHHYIDGYEECGGIIILRQGEKRKFAIIFDNSEEIDIIYAKASDSEKGFGCYLVSDNWKQEQKADVIENDTEISAEQNEMILMLERLRNAGILTEDEYESKKELVLNVG